MKSAFVEMSHAPERTVGMDQADRFVLRGPLVKFVLRDLLVEYVGQMLMDNNVVLLSVVGEAAKQLEEGSLVQRFQDREFAVM